MGYFQEAADRFTDTSWQIHKQWSTETHQPFPPLTSASKEKITNNVDASHNARLNHVNSNTSKSPQQYTKVQEPLTPEVRKIIQIETVQTTCETVANPVQSKSDSVFLVRKCCKVTSF